MSRIFVHGLGAVSPAGWGVTDMCDALGKNVPIPTQPQARPGWQKPLQVRSVPPPVSRPAFLAHPRLRRAGAITQFAVGAALEALGENISSVQNGSLRLGIIVGVMAGSVNYTRRFFEEVIKEPATASPLLFPETVFNAPASHLAAFLGSNTVSYTLVGDDGVFLQGLALAAQWLAIDKVDICLVIGAEETDWVLADAVRVFQRDDVHGAGAGAILLKKNPDSGALAELTAVTDSFAFTQIQPRAKAAHQMRAQFPSHAQNELLCLATKKNPRSDAAENSAWSDWPGKRLAPRAVLGEAFVAASAWQCVAACDALRQNKSVAANVSVVGTNQQAIGARFFKMNI